MSELPKEWAELDDNEVVERLKENDIDDYIISYFCMSKNYSIKKIAKKKANEKGLYLATIFKDYCTYQKLPNEYKKLNKDQFKQLLEIESFDEDILEMLYFNTWGGFEIHRKVLEKIKTNTLNNNFLEKVANGDDSYMSWYAKKGIIYDKPFMEITIQDIHSYVNKTLKVLNEEDLKESITLSIEGIYQQDQNYISKKELIKKEAFTADELIEIAESENCFYGPSCNSQYGIIEDQMEIFLNPSNRYQDSNHKLIFSEEELLSSGVISIDELKPEKIEGPFAEIGINYCDSYKLEVELAKVNEINFSLLEIKINKYFLLDEIHFGIEEVTYDGKKLNIDIDDSGLEVTTKGIKLFNKAHKDNYECIFKAYDDQFENEEYLESGLRKWLGLGPNDEWPETEDS